MTPLRTALIVAAFSGATAAAIAVDHSGVRGLFAAAFAAQSLSDAELQTKLQSQGYTNIQNLQHDGNRVLVTATKDGQTSQLTVSARTGQVGVPVPSRMWWK